MSVQHLIAWGAFLVLVLAMLAFDLFVLQRQPHKIKMTEAVIGTVIPVTLAMLFLGLVYLGYQQHWLNLGVPPPGVTWTGAEALYHPTTGGHAAMQYLTGYLVELSLSADNVFLFVLLMNFFEVPAALQHRVLFWGVIGALFMCAGMILVGGALLARFGWIMYIFAAFLLYSAFRMLFHGSEETDPSSSLGVRLARRILPIRPGFQGKNFFTRADGKRYATTLFVVLVCIEATDLVFALDSIPAIFGITKDTFLVFTSNVFAILGLRSMYFLLAGVMDKFHYLRQGLAVILGFVGVKMLLPLASDAYVYFTGNPDPDWHVAEWASLAIILGTLGAAIGASLLFPKKAHTHNPLDNPDMDESPGPGAEGAGSTPP